MIALLRPQPNARSVGQPEPAALGLLMGNLEPLTLPDTLDPLVVDCPARLAQQFGDLAIAIMAVLPGKLDNIDGETPLVVTTTWDLALHSAIAVRSLRCLAYARVSIDPNPIPPSRK